MADLKASVIVNLTGDLEKRAKDYGQAIDGMANRSHRAFTGIGTAVQKLGAGLSFLGNRWTALAGIVGFGALVRQTMDMQTRLEHLGVDARASTAEIRGLWDEINNVAERTDIRVDPKEMLSAIETIVEKTGDLKFAKEQLVNIGQAISGTGARGSEIGALVAELPKMGITGQKDVRTSLESVFGKGQEGAFPLAKLAALAPRLVSAYAARGRIGTGAIDELATILQVAMQGTGDPERSATATEALLRTFDDPEKIAKLQSGGVQVFEPEPLKQGKEVLRPITSLVPEIIGVAKGKNTVLSEVFDSEAMKVLQPLSAEYGQTGKMDSLHRFMGASGKGLLAESSARMANTIGARVAQNTNRLQKTGTERMYGPLEYGTAAGAALLEGDVDRGAQDIVRAFGSEPLARGRANTEAIRQQKLRDTTPARLTEEMSAFDRQRARMQEELERRGLVPARMAEERETPAAQYLQRMDALFQGGQRRPTDFDARDRGAGATPNGTVTIKVLAEPGTAAKVESVEGHGIDADSGLIMRGGL